jgi:hypothetical protein
MTLIYRINQEICDKAGNITLLDWCNTPCRDVTCNVSTFIILSGGGLGINPDTDTKAIGNTKLTWLQWELHTIELLLYGGKNIL